MPKAAVKPATSAAPALKVELWEIAKIIPYGNNPKAHPPKQVEAIARQLEEFGWDQPIVVDENGVILKGHGRRQAAIFNGYAQAPVYQRLGLSEAQKIALRLGDNKSAESKWIEEALRQELQQLEALTYDLTLTAFSLDEVDTLLQQLQARDTDRPPPSSAEGATASGNGAIDSSTAPAHSNGSTPASSGSSNSGSASTHQEQGRTSSSQDDDFELDAPPPSTVRMLNLFFDTSSYPQVMQWIEFLNDELGTANPTDCIFQVLKEAYEDRSCL